MASVAEAPGVPNEPRSAREHILAVARECFERFGLNRTRLEDVARAAGVSRQTVYNHFADKADLVGEYMYIDAQRTVAQARADLDLEAGSLELLVQAGLALLASSEAASSRSTFVGADSWDFTVAILNHADRVYEALRQYWYPLFEILKDRGDLRTDLDWADTVQWLTYVQLRLHHPPFQLAADTEELTGYFRDFVFAATVALEPSANAVAGS